MALTMNSGNAIENTMPLKENKILHIEYKELDKSLDLEGVFTLDDKIDSKVHYSKSDKSVRNTMLHRAVVVYFCTKL